MQVTPAKSDTQSDSLQWSALLRQLHTTVSAHKWLALVLLCGIVVTGMSLTFLTAPVYQSSIKVLVSRERVDPRISAGSVSGDLPRPEIAEEEFNSELEIIRSREVIEAVVKELKLAQEAEPAPSRLDRVRKLYRKWLRIPETSPLERTIREVTERLDAVSIRKSRIILVTYQDTNPEQAALVLNTLYQKYAEHHLKLHGNEEAAGVFEREAATFREKLEAATEAVKRFDGNNGIVDAAAQKDILLRQYYEAQNQANAAQTERVELTQRLDALQQQLAAQPEKLETGTITRYTLALDKMKEELLALELQRTQLLQKYQPGARYIREIEQRIAQAREAVKREEANPPQERSFALNDIHRRLQNDVLSTQANLAAVQERQQRLSTLVAQYRARVLDVDRWAFEKAELERLRSINEEAWLLYQKKAQEAGITKALNQHKVVNVSLAESAHAATRPISPKPLVNLGVLVVMGLVVALAGTILAERLSPRLRSEAQIRHRYKSRVLARLPDVARS
ncbi:MAG: hypothetical protein JST84_13210 [Acidobacteria bacterium]|nr:hypothetical protein [Acidobacteriota bacterium]